MDLALFDFDHTITHVDTYSRFLRSIATPEQLARARLSIGPWLAGYRLDLVPAHGIRKRVTRLAFTGRQEEEIHELGLRFSTEALPDYLRPEMMQRIEWHQSRGDTIVVVSGSLDAYLRPWCEQHGLAVICNRLEAGNGTLTGRYDGGDCGSDKKRRIRAQYDVSRFPCVHAYGDSREDKPMLALAHKRWYRGRPVS